MKNIRNLIVMVFFLSHYVIKANAQKINPKEYRFFRYTEYTDYPIAENIPKNEFDLLLIYSDIKTNGLIRENIAIDSYSLIDIIKKYKKIELKLISFSNFKKLNGVEGGTVYDPKYPSHAAIYDIDKNTFIKKNPQKIYIKNETELLNLINLFAKTYNKLDKDSTQTLEDIKSKMQTKYTLIKEVNCDLNNDNKKDIILISKSKKIDRTEESPDAIMASPVYVLLNIDNKVYKVYKNNNIIYTSISSCPAEGFQKLITKDSYFTIEQNNCGGWYFMYEYITFKFDIKTNEILLYKFGVSTTDRRDSNKSLPIKIYTRQNFGKISFQDYNSDNILEKSNR